MARKSSRNTPVVLSGVLYTEDEFTGAQIDSDRWIDFLKQGRSFYVDAGGFTARCEKRRNTTYWYAYKKQAGKLLKIYLGAAINMSVLIAAAARLKLLSDNQNKNQEVL